MSRVAGALPCKIHHGIIEWYLHRTLLWRRVDGEITNKISYGYPIPSWSWMAYPGGIDFIYEECDWGDMEVIKDITFDGKALHAFVWKLVDPITEIQQEDGHTKSRLQNGAGLNIGWINFDTEVTKAKYSKPPNLVVVARLRRKQSDGPRCFVLFVEQISEKFERVGVGMIQEDCQLENIGRNYVV